MDSIQKLSSYLGETMTQESNVPCQQRLQNYNTFLTLFGIQLVHRFPGVLNLDSIEVPVVEDIAKFTAVCSTIASNVWIDISRDVEKTRRVLERRVA